MYKKYIKDSMVAYAIYLKPKFSPHPLCFYTTFSMTINKSKIVVLLSNL